MTKEQKYLDFDQYIRQGEPAQKDKAEAWRVAIGLQAVDGLKTSEYLQLTARRNIEGDITIDEARDLLQQYYTTRTARDRGDPDNEEADKVSVNITKILSSGTFDFSANGIISLHRRIFDGVFKHAGRVRDYDISKKEWVLEGASVSYLNWEDLHRALEYDIAQERAYSYKGISRDEMIAHLTSFVSGIWQIHAFCEGNTRTTAVFTIQYLRSVGFDINNELFANHSWYFRNALVRANYKNLVKGIDYSPVYLERFFRNLLLGEHWDLRNRYLHIHPSPEWSIQPELSSSAGQAQDKLGTSTGQVQDKFHTDNPNIATLIRIVGDNELSVKEMMKRIRLTGRDNFLKVYLSPSINAGFIRPLYPDSPRHPRQKYLLTTKGMILLQALSKKEAPNLNTMIEIQ